MFRKLLHIILLIAFTATSVCPAQGLEIVLPAPGAMVSPSASFEPITLMGMKIYPKDPLRMDFIIDHGDLTQQGARSREQGKELGPDTIASTAPRSTLHALSLLENESNKLIRYFLASMTVPEDEMWVNLSPYEPDRIVAKGLGTTALGRDMLAQDYLLKQLTASLMHPDTELGAQFWKKVYALAQEKFGTTEIDPDTFNKVWIVPENAAVLVRGDRVFVTSAKLKVMLEADYLAETQESGLPSGGHDPAGFVSPSRLPSAEGLDVKATQGSSEAQALTQQVLREVIIPVIENEVNEGTTFAPLRQIYKAMILATWYKRKLKDSLLTQAYAEGNKVEGLGDEGANVKGQTSNERNFPAASGDASDVRRLTSDPTDPQAIWQRYVDSFKTGVANLIREEADPVTGDVLPRKYFTGGLAGVVDLAEVTSVPADWAQDQAMRDHSEVAVKLSADFSETAPGDKVQSVRGVNNLIAAPSSRAGVSLFKHVRTVNVVVAGVNNLGDLKEGLIVTRGLRARDPRLKVRMIVKTGWDRLLILVPELEDEIHKEINGVDFIKYDDWRILREVREGQYPADVNIYAGHINGDDYHDWEEGNPEILPHAPLKLFLGEYDVLRRVNVDTYDANGNISYVMPVGFDSDSNGLYFDRDVLDQEYTKENVAQQLLDLELGGQLPQDLIDRDWFSVYMHRPGMRNVFMRAMAEALVQGGDFLVRPKIVFGGEGLFKSAQNYGFQAISLLSPGIEPSPGFVPGDVLAVELPGGMYWDGVSALSDVVGITGDISLTNALLRGQRFIYEMQTHKVNLRRLMLNRLPERMNRDRASELLFLFLQDGDYHQSMTRLFTDVGIANDFRQIGQLVTAHGDVLERVIDRIKAEEGRIPEIRAKQKMLENESAQVTHDHSEVAVKLSDQAEAKKPIPLHFDFIEDLPEEDQQAIREQFGLETDPDFIEYPVLVALSKNNEALGVYQFSRSSNRWVLGEGIDVLNEFWGRGVGTLLSLELFKRMKEEGYKVFSRDTNTKSPRAVRFRRTLQGVLGPKVMRRVSKNSTARLIDLNEFDYETALAAFEKRVQANDARSELVGQLSTDEASTDYAAKPSEEWQSIPNVERTKEKRQYPLRIQTPVTLEVRVAGQEEIVATINYNLTVKGKKGNWKEGRVVVVTYQRSDKKSKGALIKNGGQAFDVPLASGAVRLVPGFSTMEVYRAAGEVELEVRAVVDHAEVTQDLENGIIISTMNGPVYWQQAVDELRLRLGEWKKAKSADSRVGLIMIDSRTNQVLLSLGSGSKDHKSLLKYLPGEAGLDGDQWAIGDFVQFTLSYLSETDEVLVVLIPPNGAGDKVFSYNYGDFHERQGLAVDRLVVKESYPLMREDVIRASRLLNEATSGGRISRIEASVFSDEERQILNKGGLSLADIGKLLLSGESVVGEAVSAADLGLADDESLTDPWGIGATALPDARAMGELLNAPAQNVIPFEPKDDSQNFVSDNEIGLKISSEIARIYSAGSLINMEPIIIDGREFPVSFVMVPGTQHDDVLVYRVGPLVLIVADFLKKVPYNFLKRFIYKSEVNEIKKRIRSLINDHPGNILIVPPEAVTQTRQNVDPHTLLALATMISRAEQFSGATVVDGGSGYGILSMMALHLGARKVIGIEATEHYRKLSQIVLRSGEWTSRQFKVHSGDLQDPELLEKIRSEVGEQGPVIGIGNLGMTYLMANMAFMKFVATLPNLKLVLNNGHYVGEGGLLSDPMNLLQNEMAVRHVLSLFGSSEFSISRNPYYPNPKDRLGLEMIVAEAQDEAMSSSALRDRIMVKLGTYREQVSGKGIRAVAKIIGVKYANLLKLLDSDEDGRIEREFKIVRKGPTKTPSSEEVVTTPKERQPPLIIKPKLDKYLADNSGELGELTLSGLAQILNVPQESLKKYIWKDMRLVVTGDEHVIRMPAVLAKEEGVEEKSAKRTARHVYRELHTFSPEQIKGHGIHSVALMMKVQPVGVKGLYKALTDFSRNYEDLFKPFGIDNAADSAEKADISERVQNVARMVQGVVDPHARAMLLQSEVLAVALGVKPAALLHPGVFITGRRNREYQVNSDEFPGMLTEVLGALRQVDPSFDVVRISVTNDFGPYYVLFHEEAVRETMQRATATGKSALDFSLDLKEGVNIRLVVQRIFDAFYTEQAVDHARVGVILGYPLEDVGTLGGESIKIMFRGDVFTSFVKWSSSLGPQARAYQATIQQAFTMMDQALQKVQVESTSVPAQRGLTTAGDAAATSEQAKAWSLEAERIRHAFKAREGEALWSTNGVVHNIHAAAGAALGVLPVIEQLLSSGPDRLEDRNEAQENFKLMVADLQLILKFCKDVLDIQVVSDDVRAEIAASVPGRSVSTAPGILSGILKRKEEVQLNDHLVELTQARDFYNKIFDEIVTLQKKVFNDDSEIKNGALQAELHQNLLDLIPEEDSLQVIVSDGALRLIASGERELAIIKYEVDGEKLIVDRFWTHPDYRQRQVIESLLAYLIAQVQSNKAVFVDVTESDLRAINSWNDQQDRFLWRDHLDTEDDVLVQTDPSKAINFLMTLSAKTYAAPSEAIGQLQETLQNMIPEESVLKVQDSNGWLKVLGTDGQRIAWVEYRIEGDTLVVSNQQAQQYGRRGILTMLLAFMMAHSKAAQIKWTFTTDDGDKLIYYLHVIKGLIEKPTLDGDSSKKYLFRNYKAKINRDAVKQHLQTLGDGAEVENAAFDDSGLAMTAGEAHVFDSLLEMADWFEAENNVPPEAEIVLMPYINSRVQKLTKGELLQAIGSDGRFSSKDQMFGGLRAGVKIVQKDGKKVFYVLISEVEAVVPPQSAVPYTTGYAMVPLSDGIANSVADHGFYLLPGRAAFFNTLERFGAVWGDDILFAVDLPNNGIWVEPQTNYMAMRLSTDRMGAALPPALRAFLRDKFVPDKDYTRTEILLAGEESGFLVHIPRQSIRMEETFFLNFKRLQKGELALEKFSDFFKSIKPYVDEPAIKRMSEALKQLPVDPAMTAGNESDPASAADGVDAAQVDNADQGEEKVTEKLRESIRNFSYVLKDKNVRYGFIERENRWLLTKDGEVQATDFFELDVREKYSIIDLKTFYFNKVNWGLGIFPAILKLIQSQMPLGWEIRLNRIENRRILYTLFKGVIESGYKEFSEIEKIRWSRIRENPKLLDNEIMIFFVEGFLRDYDREQRIRSEEGLKPLIEMMPAVTRLLGMAGFEDMRIVIDGLEIYLIAKKNRDRQKSDEAAMTAGDAAEVEDANQKGRLFATPITPQAYMEQYGFGNYRRVVGYDANSLRSTTFAELMKKIQLMDFDFLYIDKKDRPVWKKMAQWTDFEFQNSWEEFIASVEDPSTKRYFPSSIEAALLSLQEKRKANDYWDTLTANLFNRYVGISYYRDGDLKGEMPDEEINRQRDVVIFVLEFWRRWFNEGEHHASSAQAAPGDDAAVTPGGIDLNAKDLNITEDGQTPAFDMAETDRVLRSGDLKGLHPIILSIRPVADFSALLK